MPESRIAQARSRSSAGVHQLHELVAPSTARRVSGLIEKLNIPNREQAGERGSDTERALPDYLQALELVSGAAQTMQTMEESPPGFRPKRSS